MRMQRYAIAILMGTASWAVVSRAQGRPITFEDFSALRAVSDPQVSPNGESVLYAVRVTDLAANRRATRTYLIPLGGGTPRAFPADTVRAAEARWSPDGRAVAYVAGGQLWIASSDGSNPRRLTSLPSGASGPVWSPRGDRLAFVSPVYPDCPALDDGCNARRDSTKEASAVKARIADQLLYRHWSSWDEGTRSHLFVVRPDGGGLTDLTAGARYDVPPPPFGGSEGYAFSPDGQELAYTAKDAGREEAWSTDVNVYVVPASGGVPRNITARNKGADQNPVYSPDGRFLVYASQATPMFESDRWRLLRYDRSGGAARELLPGWDRNAESYLFAPDGRTVYVGTGDRGRNKLFRVGLDAAGLANGRPQAIVSTHNSTGFTMSSDGRVLVWLRDAVDRPAEVFSRALGAETGDAADRQVTRENDAAVRTLALNPAEDFWFRGARGDSVHGFIVRPPGWRAGEKYPVVVLIHGGPQGAWLDNWGGRWSFQLFASIGAAVVAINPRGSTGYGQAFTNGVTQDWGGKVYTDLMRGLDAALARNPWMDSSRVAAAGGSFGGYMVNWIAGRTNRFKALVSHAGIFNLEHMYGATEELWFTEYEFGGPFWKPKAMTEQYRRWSPHLAAAKFKTPMLVVHGEQDFRVPYYEGVGLFSALQRQGVPSRLLLYPDEGHWILKPQNAALWYREVLGWIRQYAVARPAS
jgi:dipeptidyl aminopeptidase/acylaminoacyl peptidase